MSIAKSRLNLRALTETAVLVAIAFVLSFFQFKLPWPNGGSVTPASMLFILAIGLRRGPVWGIGGALAYSLLQMLQSFYPPPVENAFNLFLVVMLDYVVAFTALGLSGLFGRRKYGILIAAPICLALRFLCHFASGILIWGPYAPEGMPTALYSLAYNGSYVGIELVLCLAAAALLLRYDKSIFSRQE
ncbi:MAG: energy-coupled thiamine transporter ThiT [Oscillospiraceae bacterium]|jgi:thiamine transporter|nr:energy-coupled thiamine transporter ThiT [Oscillospiraceae bacterium]